MSFVDTLKAFCFAILGWLKTYGLLLTIISVASLVGSILFCTLAIAYLPFDYFLFKERESRIKQPVLRVVLKCLKNLLAILLIIVGIIMFLTPGQGVLTVLIGIIISDIPGKRRLEHRIIRSGTVLSAANFIRSRFKRPLFVIEDQQKTSITPR